jgi:hypothetical protein
MLVTPPLPALPAPPLNTPRPLDELHEVADGKRMYSNYRMDVIDKMLGPSVAAPVAVQVRGGGLNQGVCACRWGHSTLPGVRMVLGETMSHQACPFEHSYTLLCTCVTVCTHGSVLPRSAPLSQHMCLLHSPSVLRLSVPPPPHYPLQVPVQGRQPGSDKPVTIPDSLVAVQAFIMWEEAGKPQVHLGVMRGFGVGWWCCSGGLGAGECKY